MVAEPDCLNLRLDVGEAAEGMKEGEAKTLLVYNQNTGEGWGWKAYAYRNRLLLEQQLPGYSCGFRNRRTGTRHCPEKGNGADYSIPGKSFRQRNRKDNFP